MSAELRTVQDAADQVRKVALFLRTQDRKNPVPYRRIRAMRWDVLGVDPPNEAGKTKIEAPPLQRRNYLNTLMQGAQWEKLLDEAETSFGQSPYHFWLDLQRLIVAALDATEGYQAARTAVVQELSLLLRRLPGSRR